MDQERVPGQHGCRGLGRNKVLRVLPLLLEGLGKGSQTSNNPHRHDHDGDEGPDHAPALGRASVAFCENTGIRGIYFAKDEIVANIPAAV